MCFTYLSSINSQAHACICLIRIYLLLFILGMAFFYSWAVLSLLASHILPTDLSVCDPSLLHQIAAQAYVCTLIQPCSTNLYTYACLLPHVLVFIPWGIHMHGSIAAQAVFPAWWYHLLSVWGVCCACPTPTVYAWGPLNTTELLSFPYACILPFSLFVEAPNQFWFYCFMLYPYPCIRSNVCLRYLYMVCF